MLASVTFPIRLALADDDPHLRTMLAEYLQSQPEFECVAVAASAEALLAELALSLPPQIVLLDLSMPGMGGLDLIPILHRRLPDVQIIVQTMHDDSERIHDALRAGATGYLIKVSTALSQYRQAILDVMSGGAAVSPLVARKMLTQFTPSVHRQPTLLSERERQVLNGLVDGLTEKQIAARLDLSATTVHTYIGRLYEKLRVRSRGELIGRAVRGELG
jgi:DNA-binding NarL/FixJ family response regulator